MTPQSRYGILVGLLVVMACGLVFTELRRDATPVDVPDPDPVATHHHARTVGQVGQIVEFAPQERRTPPQARRVEPQPQPRLEPRVVAEVQPEPRPNSELRRESNERTTETINTMLAAVAPEETVPDGRPVFVEMDAQELREHFNAPREASPAPVIRQYRTYTVQEGDNLTRIARQTLSDGSMGAVNELFELNRDVMDDPDHVVVGMRLRIPVREGN
jgi:nucleoid-associated protein YgaU